MTLDTLNQAVMQPTAFDNIIDKIQGSVYKDEQTFKNVKLLMKAFKSGDDATKASARKDDFVDVSTKLQGVLNEFESQIMTNITGNLDAPQEVKTACQSFNDTFLLDYSRFAETSNIHRLTPERQRKLDQLRRCIDRLSRHSMYRDFRPYSSRVSEIPPLLDLLQTVVNERHEEYPDVLPLATTIGNHLLKIHYKKLLRDASTSAQTLRSDATYQGWWADTTVPDDSRHSTDHLLSKVVRGVWNLNEKREMIRMLSTLHRWDGGDTANRRAFRTKVDRVRKPLIDLGLTFDRLVQRSNRT
ncbi:hypothetical protein I302_100048 [Kwoniella bestiolae CBS 10118]|uniref:Uncharacterized protein n=1 Tax=Kwoniella bestiolae CBS 10118 TaxID=1296100 RepID=A0A1B9G3W0_9TREE|nr:hypothetical protein I302_03420 [Kwoniella bestiolae CBS 10118]OCF25747.1 hypothetical protein I302_03420 [Kwoniella bestiolae CBS 10118]